MTTQVYDLPNVDHFKLAVLTESAQDLAPLMRSIGNAKARLTPMYADADLTAGLLEHDTVDTDNTWPAKPTAGVAFGTLTAVIAAIADTELKAQLQQTYSDGTTKVYDQSREIVMGNISGILFYFDNLTAPKLTDPIEADDDTLSATTMLFDGYQLLLNAYVTLFTQRGFVDPTL